MPQGLLEDGFILIFAEDNTTTMCISSDIKSFVLNGARVFFVAARRRYDVQTDGMKKLRDEVMNTTSPRDSDAQHRLGDRRNVERDIRISFNKLSLRHG